MIIKTIKNAFTKKALVLSATAFITIASAVSANAQKANFSGEWKLNESKSELGQFGARMAAKKLKLVGETESINIGRFLTNQNGEEINTAEVLNYNGNETESTVWGTAKKKSKAKWSDDGQTLNISSTTVFERDGEKFEVKADEVWKLLEEGKVLSIQSTSTSSRGTNTVKLVYDKAS